MAQYNGTFACGHEGTVNVIGPQKDRVWKIEKRFSGLCPECYEKQRAIDLERKQKEAAEKAKEMELPELEGSEKQVAWANQIRNKFIDNFQDLTKKEIRKTLVLLYDLTMEEANKIAKKVDEIQDELMNTKTSSSYFIDNRNDFWKVVYWIGKELVDKEENPQLEQILEEGTVYPTETKHDKPVKIEIIDNDISIVYEKNYEVINLVKSLKYKWNGAKWHKKINEMNGAVEDRAAELGNKLLLAGFPVIILDENIKQKAIKGEYEEECNRWISTKENKLKIKAYDDLDIYSNASCITGAKWYYNSLLVDVSHADEVEDFAKTLHFQFTQKAKDLIAKYREELKSRQKTSVTEHVTEAINDNGLDDILNSSREVLEDLIDED